MAATFNNKIISNLMPWIIRSTLYIIMTAVPAFASERSNITATIDGSAIKVFIYMPNGRGPFPLLILSHGSPRQAWERDNFGSDTLMQQAEAFANSGVAVAVPIRRGYGGQGRWAETYHGCDHADYYEAGLEGGRDIQAAIAEAIKLPNIDSHRVALMGVSAGGWASLASATQGNVLGVVNFAGGRGSQGPNSVCKPERLIEAAGNYGAGSHVPEIWIYSANDLFFNPELAKKMVERFNGAGGQALFLEAPKFGNDGHEYIKAISSWKPTVDKFLKNIGFIK